MILIDRKGNKLHEFELMAGDMFSVNSLNETWYPETLDEFVSRSIIFFEEIYNKDHKANFSHSGLILNSSGETSEALWTVKRQNINVDYKGKEVIVARYMGASLAVKISNLEKLLDKYEGNVYPVWRIAMHMFPFIDRISILDMPVCSEYDYKYGGMIGAYDDKWAGKNPDNLVDTWKNPEYNFKVLGQGFVA